MTEGWKESVEVLMNAFFPGSNRNPRAEELLEGESPGDGPGEEETDKWDKEIEYEEVERALRRMSVGKSPGLDGITTEMLRAIWKYASGYVKELLVACLREGKIPAEWKKANVVILLKSPDRVKSDAGSYRPISLVSAWSKLIESVLVKRLKERMKEYESENQYGFKEGKSTEDAWMKVKSTVKEAEEKYVLGIFVDFKGAFDNLEWPVLLKRLREIGCKEMDVWSDYFSERYVCAKGEVTEIWKKAERGCPQGSVCGPVM